MYSIILLIVSVLPVVLLGTYIYIKDKNKEPLGLLLRLFFSGVLSVFLVLVYSSVLQTFIPFFGYDETKLSLVELFISVFIGIALIEEFSKWIMLYIIAYDHKEFDEFYDMIQYAVFVALGFACLENIGYVFQHGIGVGFIRAVLSVPGHAFDGVFMGYYLGLAKMAKLNNNKQLEKKNKFLSLLVPTITHGIFDYCLMSGNGLLLFLFLVFIVFLYVHSIKRVVKISGIRRKMKYQDNYCPVCGTKIESDYCPSCGRKND